MLCSNKYHASNFDCTLVANTNFSKRKNNEDWFLIENGYKLYSLLFEINKLHKRNQSAMNVRNIQSQNSNLVSGRCSQYHDIRYDGTIFQLMPKEERNDYMISKSSIGRIWDMFDDVSKYIYYFFISMRTISNKNIDDDMEDDKYVTKWMKYYADISSQIEIMVDGNSIQYTFLILPYCKFISNAQKYDFVKRLDRSDPQAIWNSVMHESGSLIYTMRKRYILENKNKLFGKILFKYDTLWEQLYVWCIILLNLWILVSYKVDSDDRFGNPILFGLSQASSRGIIKALTLSSAILWILSFITIFASHFIHKISKNKTIFKQYKQMKSNQIKERMTRPQRIMNGLFETILNYKIIHMSLWGISIVLGFSLSPLFYTFILTYWITYNSSMNYLIKALWLSKSALIATFIIMLIITYIFAAIAYSEFSQYYSRNECHYLFEWFVVNYDNTHKQAGIGNYLESAYGDSQAEYIDIDYSRVIYDNLEFILITILCMSIVTGNHTLHTQISINILQKPHY